MLTFNVQENLADFIYLQQFSKWGLGDCSYILFGRRLTFIAETCTAVNASNYEYVKQAIKRTRKAVDN